LPYTLPATEIAVAIGSVNMPGGQPLGRWCGADHTPKTEIFTAQFADFETHLRPKLT
jgi:hypothetical protein